MSYGRRARSEQELRLLPAQIEQITRTVRHAPEVMVKISGGGQSAKAVAAHFKYIGRQEFEIETDHGEHIRGQEAEKALIADWELDLDAAESRSPYRGASGRKPAKLVHNIVLSMPKGAPAAGVLEASRAFAREQFALKHRYALVLHTDQPHPHVHLVVKAMSEQGRRINIRKETLREWRRNFASHLRAQGIAANATERAVRGVTKRQKSDGIYRAMRAGRSTHMRARAESVAAALHAGNMRVEPVKKRILDTRRDVIRHWLRVQEAFRAAGNVGLADEVERFVSSMPPPRTEREWMALALTEGMRDRRQERSLARTR
ncbi:MAG: relaxase/mobilization nuclease domain-containing protein [Gammaproteobacteria bacterium]|nr:relaxase/mobilization nuclease domain-containing protein [Gammaproteobacteria bacterium]